MPRVLRLANPARPARRGASRAGCPSAFQNRPRDSDSVPTNPTRATLSAGSAARAHGEPSTETLLAQVATRARIAQLRCTESSHRDAAYEDTSVAHLPPR